MNVLSTSRENIIGDFKLRNNFVNIQLLIFPILPWQYWLFYIDSNLLLFIFISLILVSVLLSFLYCSHSYLDSFSCRSFTILKAITKSFSLLFAIAFKSDNYCFCLNGYKKSNDNKCYRKVGKVITLLRAIIEKS